MLIPAQVDASFTASKYGQGTFNRNYSPSTTTVQTTTTKPAYDQTRFYEAPRH